MAAAAKGTAAATETRRRTLFASWLRELAILSARQSGRTFSALISQNPSQDQCSAGGILHCLGRAGRVAIQLPSEKTTQNPTVLYKNGLFHYCIFSGILGGFFGR